MASLSLSRRLAAVASLFRGGAAGGAVLIAAALIAILWANSPWADTYEHLRHLPLGISIGGRAFGVALEAWVNDGLMAVFFLLVGLEIRRELTEGQLASLPRAAAPALAALGGMVVPAAIYAAFNWHDPETLRGWAIPVATDIAFSLAVLRVLGRRVPVGLTVFLTALAIIDDLFAIVVIALFYTESVRLLALLAAAAVWLALWLLGRGGVRLVGPFLLGFAALWVCLAFSGVHPTLAGVAVAFAVPRGEPDGRRPAHALEQELSGWVAYAVLPLFGLVNAGLRFDTLSADMLLDPVVPGIFLGLFLGKQIGVFGVTWLGCRTGLVRLPAQLSWPLLYGAAVLCGIGFTMSLFIGHLAFAPGVREDELKLAVFAASVLSALCGLAILMGVTARARVPAE